MDKWDHWEFAFNNALKHEYLDHLHYIVRLAREDEEKLLVLPGTDGIMVEELETAEEVKNVYCN